MGEAAAGLLGRLGILSQGPFLLSDCPSRIVQPAVEVFDGRLDPNHQFVDLLAVVLKERLLSDQLREVCQQAGGRGNVARYSSRRVVKVLEPGDVGATASGVGSSVAAGRWDRQNLRRKAPVLR